jgi:hypothetical protein
MRGGGGGKGGKGGGGGRGGKGATAHQEGGNGMARKRNGTASLPFQEPAIMAMGSAPPPPIAPSGSSCSAQLRD